MIRKFLSSIFLLVLCSLFFFPSRALAEPNAAIVSCPNTATITQPFQVEIELSNLEAGGKYFVKSVGGKDWYDVKTWSEANSVWLSWNSSWEQMPSVNASAEGTANLSLTSMFVEGTPVGNNLYKIRIRKDDSGTTYDSSSKTISVLEAPTPTPTATPEPTAIPTSPPPTATPTPKPPTATSKPSMVTPTVKPTATSSSFPTDSAEGAILGESQSLGLTGTPEEESAKKESKPSKFLPVIFIFSGLAFIGGSFYLYWRARQVSDFPES
ncbi:MAG TPA: hypothetical protein VMW04_00105 [Patescibacteria group bacterium]|nr:hypothetical protein [Patescibacteria group bacterium]